MLEKPSTKSRDYKNMSIKNIQNSENYKWGKNCDGWKLVDTNSLSVIQEKMPPKTEENLHFHENCQQFFYILSGIAEFQIENEILIVEENNGIHIPKMKKHKIMNRTEHDLEFLVISEPKSHGDRINL